MIVLSRLFLSTSTTGVTMVGTSTAPLLITLSILRRVLGSLSGFWASITAVSAAVSATGAIFFQISAASLPCATYWILTRSASGPATKTFSALARPWASSAAITPRAIPLLLQMTASILLPNLVNRFSVVAIALSGDQLSCD